MSAADYLAAEDIQGARLRGTPVVATWDPELTAAMQARGLAVHEEQVVDYVRIKGQADQASDVHVELRPGTAP